MPERRVDPDDKVAYTWEELSAFYKKKYKKKEIEEYWVGFCKPAKKSKAEKAVAEPSSKAKSKAKPVAAKAKSEPEAPAALKYKEKKIPEVDKRMKELGLEVPEAVAPVASYKPFCQSGKLLFVSGQIPKCGDDAAYKGQLGKEVSVESGEAAAKQCGMNLIAQIKAACDGNLDRVSKIVRIEGFVSCTPDFTQHPAVINGCSNLMEAVFGKDVGGHSRFAVGCSSLPLGYAVEVGAVVELKAVKPR